MEFRRYGDMSSDELLDAQAHVWNHIFSFINSMSLKCAVELGIPDLIHNYAKPMPLSQLLDALPIDKSKSHAVHRLMRLLTRSKFFVEEEEDCYWLTPASMLLLRNASASAGPLLRLILDPVMLNPCESMSKWLLSDSESPFEVAHGKSIWEYMGQDSRLNNIFNEAMSTDTRIVLDVLLRDFKQVFDGVSSLVDVGGSDGTTCKAILGVFPNLQCTVLDLPHVVDGLQGTDNLTYVAGDMFKAIPCCDAILLKWIMHDWDDEACVKILKKCKEAIRERNGKVMIIDVVIQSDEEGKEGQLLMDMAVMAYYNGKERSQKQFEKLFQDAGFSNYTITAALGLRSLVQLYP